LSEKREHTESTPEGEHVSLHADCEHCFALCCVAPAFSASADFAINKPSGQACPHLQPDFRCGIHTNLREQGFRGCTVYDCFGAGQKVSQGTYAGQDWRLAPHTATQMFEVFPIVRDLHELLWYLTEALTLQQVGPLHDELSLARHATDRLTEGSPKALLQLDVEAHRRVVSSLLLQTSENARSEIQHTKTDYRGADLIGAKLEGADLRGASLRGAYLIGSDLRRADLRMADLIGADLRGADLGGANLTGSIFLIQSQLDSAKGDDETRLSPSFVRPAHWSSSGT